MKKLMTVALALAALTMLAPQAGFAQTWNNQIGIYYAPSGNPMAANYVATPNVPFNAYLVVTNPVNHSFNGGTDTMEPITMVDGFECKINFPNSPTFFKLSETFPASAIDVGAKPSYVVGFATSVPVTGDAVVLCTWQFMVSTGDQYDISLGVTQFPSIPGVMSILDNGDADDPLSPVYASTGDIGVPVFSINGTGVVAVENETWGGVKSLFR